MVYCARGRERGREEEREGGGGGKNSISRLLYRLCTHITSILSRYARYEEERERETEAALGGISQPAVHNHVR